MVEHSDVDFSELRYEHYPLSRFTALTEPLYRVARNGTSQEDFDKLHSDMINELYYIGTLMTMAELNRCKNSTDAGIQNEYSYISNVFSSANGEYRAVMHTLSVSSHADLLSEIYTDTYLEQFRQYDASSVSDEFGEQENDLVGQYYTLAAAETPDYDAIADVFVQLVNLRNRIASASGYDNYAAYAYETQFARNYSPQQAAKYCDFVKKYFVPVVKSYAGRIGDLTNDLYHSDAIDCSPEKILSCMSNCMPQISPHLNDALQYLLKYHLYDVEQSDKKADAGFTEELYSYNEPFIFNSSEGSYYDYTNLFHEFGHFANSFYFPSDLLFGVSDNDLSELQSQGMEVMFLPFYDQIFGSKNGRIIQCDTLLNLLYSVVDGAMYDEFLQRVFAEPELTAEKARSIYAEVFREYGYSYYDGWDMEWMNISHHFEMPFYYISYSVSAVSALELFSIQQKSRADAVNTYLKVETIDPEVLYFSEALQQVGLSDVLQENTCLSVAKSLAEYFASQL
jgi:Oligoendopeptidase F